MDEYISKEVVAHFLKAYSEKECNSNSPYGMIISSILNKAERALFELSAADVQPIRHGRWINDGDCMLCSCCNYAYNSWFMGSNYCPNCGADMRKE